MTTSTNTHERRRRRATLRSLLAATALAATSPSLPAAEPGWMVADALIWRPAGVVATAVGSGVFIGSLPLTFVTQTWRPAMQSLVMEPVRFTFTRPLGDTSGY